MKKIIIPEERLNELAQEVSGRLLARHFFDQGKITGDGLRSFANHQQVNKFLIFQVYQVWESQMNKLNHPYFDLDHAEIKQTIKSLENQISQHISISEEEFQPLLKRAVYNNLKLLLDPEETFNRFFFAQADKIPLEVYARYVQYFSDLDFVVQSILRYFQKNKLESVDKDVFFLKMKKAVDLYNKKSGQSFEQYRDSLFKVLTGKNISEIEQEAQKAKEEEERLLRQKEEEKRKAEEQKRRMEEEKRRKEEEDRRKQEEAERLKLEEEKRKEEEERRKKEEEERQKQEELKRQSSFFDSLGTVENFFDLDEEEEEEEKAQSKAPEVVASAPVVEEPVQPKEEPTPEVKEEKEAESKSFPVAEPPSNGNGSYVWTPAEEKTQEKVEETPPAEVEPQLPTPEPTPEVSTPTPRQEGGNTLLDKLKDKEGEKPKETKTSVLDMLNQRSKTIADSIVGKSASDSNATNSGKIKLDEIPIHKQYQYVQKVFEGNNVRFRIIVDKVNNANNASEIEDILKKFVLNNDKLNREDAVVQEFIGMLQNRF